MELVKYLSVMEFSNKMGIHPNTVMRMIKSGKIQAADVRTTPKRPTYRIPETEAARLLRMGQVAAIKALLEDEMEKKNG